jgi:putative effector of murein hydrolase
MIKQDHPTFSWVPITWLIFAVATILYSDILMITFIPLIFLGTISLRIFVSALLRHYQQRHSQSNLISKKRQFPDEEDLE